MKKIFVAIGVIVVLAIVAILVLPSLLPAEKIKSQVVAAVKSATGRDLSIDGNVSVSVFPSLSVQIANASLSNLPGFSAKKFIQVGSLDARVKLFPLLAGRVEVNSFKLVNPIIALEVNEQGRADWEFPTTAASSNTAPTKSDTSLSDINLGDVGIDNGVLTYKDAKVGTDEKFDGINIKISLKSLDDPLAVKGALKWRNQSVTLDLDVAKPRVMISGTGTTAASLHIDAEPIKVAFKGEAKGADKSFSGDTDLNIPSLRGLMAWTTGKPLDMPGSGFGPLTIKGKLSMRGSQIAFSQASIALDAIKSTGELAINTGGSRPAIKGRLDVENLDLNPYLPPEETSKSAQQSNKQEWSDAPIDASALKAADVDFALRVGSIKIRKIQIGKSAVSIALHGGQLAADLTEMELYKGAGKGIIKIDGSQAGVGVDASFSLKSLQAEPFLADAADFTRLSGTGNSELAIMGRGHSQREIISSLSGKGSVAFLDGAIKGIDIAGMIRNVTSAFTASGAVQKTDFAELSGTYSISSGIVSNQDLSLKAPVLRIAGSGAVDLPKRSLNYRIEPKIAATLQGQGGQDAAGITVPVIVSGPWDNLSYRPDLGAVVKGAASQAVKGALSGKIPKLPGLPSGFLPQR